MFSIVIFLNDNLNEPNLASNLMGFILLIMKKFISIILVAPKLSLEALIDDVSQEKSLSL